jgi:hypothetical protein
LIFVFYRNVLDSVFSQHRLIEHQGADSRSNWGELTQHDVLRHTAQRINFRESRSFHENLYRLLKGGSHQGSTFCAVHTVTGDSHDKSLGGHNINQQSQVAIVHVRTIEGNHHTQLIQNCTTDSFDSKHFNGLDDVV